MKLDQKFLIFLAATSFLAVASCSKVDKNTEYPQTREQRELERMGKITGKEGIVLFGGKKKGHSATADAINVNSYLWRASLDVIHLIHAPIVLADPFGGVITTDWYMPAPNSKERFKFNILIVGPTLRSDAIKVSAFKQILDKNSNWRDAEPNPHFSQEIEDKILLKARDLKVGSL